MGIFEGPPKQNDHCSVFHRFSLSWIARTLRIDSVGPVAVQCRSSGGHSGGHSGGLLFAAFCTRFEKEKKVYVLASFF